MMVWTSQGLFACYVTEWEHPDPYLFTEVFSIMRGCLVQQGSRVPVT